MSIGKDMETKTMPQINVDIGSLDYSNYTTEATTDDHLRTLKALTQRLRLETRRPSYFEWKAQVEANVAKVQSKAKESADLGQYAGLEHTEKLKSNGYSTDLSPESGLASGRLKGFRNIDEALIWLRKELVSKMHIWLSFI